MRERPFVVHFRNHKGKQIVGNGGATVAFIPTDDGNCKAGVSICHTNDTFNRHLGVEIAAGRAKKYGKNLPKPCGVVEYIQIAKMLVVEEVLEKYSESISLERVEEMKTPAEIKGIINA